MVENNNDEFYEFLEQGRASNRGGSRKQVWDKFMNSAHVIETVEEETPIVLTGK